MSYVCPNCSATHGCGCQEKIAPDGRKCCTNCIASYTSNNPQPAAPPPTPQQTQNSNPFNIQIKSATYHHNYL